MVGFYRKRRFTQTAMYPAFTTAEQLQAGVAVQQDVLMLRPDIQFIFIALSSSIKNTPSALKSLDLSWDLSLFTGPLGIGARGADLQKRKEVEDLVHRLLRNRGLVLNYYLIVYEDSTGRGDARVLIESDRVMPETRAVAAMTQYDAVTASC